MSLVCMNLRLRSAILIEANKLSRLRSEKLSLKTCPVHEIVCTSCTRWHVHARVKVWSATSREWHHWRGVYQSPAQCAAATACNRNLGSASLPRYDKPDRRQQAFVPSEEHAVLTRWETHSSTPLTYVDKHGADCLPPQTHISMSSADGAERASVSLKALILISADQWA